MAASLRVATFYELTGNLIGFATRVEAVLGCLDLVVGWLEVCECDSALIVRLGRSNLVCACLQSDEHSLDGPVLAVQDGDSDAEVRRRSADLRCDRAEQYGDEKSAQ
jgi:hypothetical protein